MKLLIITQKVDKNDPVLGFFHRWIEEFSKDCEKVIVIALEVGVYNLPTNVKVLSLGKESGQSRLKYLWRFYKHIWRERGNYETVFVHMNPIYIVLAGWWWRLSGKRIALWYTHRQVDLKLRLAERLVSVIFSASRKSFRLATQKVNFVGHGVDTETFVPRGTVEAGNNEVFPEIVTNSLGPEMFKILSVGRISPVKNYESLIEVIDLLVNKKRIKNIKVFVLGNYCVPQHESYFDKIRKKVEVCGLRNNVFFLGPVTHSETIKYYQVVDLLVNLSHTGSMDKVVLESMSCGGIVLTSNEAFQEMLDNNLMFISSERPEELARRILKIKNMSPLELLLVKENLRAEVVSNHSLSKLSDKIITILKDTKL